MAGNSNRGFANMNPDQQKEIARKGGLAVSSNREHMANIGRKGGQASGVTRSQKAPLVETTEEQL